MKEYKLLIISSIILILSFLNGWFGDRLFDTLTPFVLPFTTIPLFVSYIICLIDSIRLVLKNYKFILNYFPLIILIMTAVINLFFPFRRIRTELELTLYENDRKTVIQMVKNGELEADEFRNAKLPNKYKRISTSGEIYIYQNNKEGSVIGFWIFRGMLSGSVELIYSDKGEQLIRDNENGHPIISIEQLKDNWYYVITAY